MWTSEVIFFSNDTLQIAGLPKYPKSPVSEHWWTVNMLKGPKDWLNVHGSFFYIFWSFPKQISSKEFVLVVSEILTHFVNLLTPDDKHSLLVKMSV